MIGKFKVKRNDSFAKTTKNIFEWSYTYPACRKAGWLFIK